MNLGRSVGRHTVKGKVARDPRIKVGNCVAPVPAVFELGAENKPMVPDPGYAEDDTLLQAAKRCPETATSVEDNEANQLCP